MAFPAIAAALARLGGGAAAGGGTQTSAAALARTGASKEAIAAAKEEEAAKKKSAAANRALNTQIIQGVAATHVMSRAVGSLSGMMTSALTAGAAAIQKFAEPILALTQLSNPAAVQMFSLAARDAMAVIGRGLLPVTEALTRGMRKMGDVYATFEPVLNRVSNVVAEAIDKIGTAWSGMAHEMG